MGAVRKSNYMFEYRITILGASAVGKTSLINRFTQDKFNNDHHPTALDHIQHIVDYKGEMCVCLLADTCGSLDFPAMRRLSISKGNGFVVVYSISDKKSFEEAEKIIDEIKDIKKDSEDEVKIMLVGNKSDCEQSQRVINRQDGITLAEKVSASNVTCDFVEVSAKDGNQVISAFHGVLNMFRPEVQIEQEPERRHSLSRSLSLRRSKKNKQQKLMKLNSRDDLLRKSNDDLQLGQDRLNKSSDDIVNNNRRDSSEGEYCERVRAISLGSAGINDEMLAKFRANYLKENGSEESSSSTPHKKYVRQNSAKEVLLRTCRDKLFAAKRKLKGSKPSRQNTVLLVN